MELFGVLEDAALPIYLIRVTRFIEYLILMSNKVTQLTLQIQVRCCLVSPGPGAAPGARRGSPCWPGPGSSQPGRY